MYERLRGERERRRGDLDRRSGVLDRFRGERRGVGVRRLGDLDRLRGDIDLGRGAGDGDFAGFCACVVSLFSASTVSTAAAATGDLQTGQ